jgi:hypothetical protein
MNSISPDFSEDIRAMKIIHAAMLAGQLIFAAVVFYLVYTRIFENSSSDTDILFKYLVPAMALGGFLIGNILFRKLIQVARKYPDLKEKLTAYRGALITSYAIPEGCSLFAIIAALLTSQLLYLGIAVIVMFYFLTLRPRPERIVKDLDLSPSEEIKIMKRE